MLRKILRQTVGFWMRPAVPVDWVQNDETSWLCHYLGSLEKSVRATRFAARIERLSAHTTRLGPQGLVVIDDIDFPGMDGCWEDISVDPRVRASAVLRRHVGIVEFK